MVARHGHAIMPGDPLRRHGRESPLSGDRMQPIPALIATLNRHLLGWANYFSFGYPRVAKRAINAFVRQRLKLHLQRRSQRPFRPPNGRSFYGHLGSLGLVYL